MPSKPKTPYTTTIACADVTYAPAENLEFPWIRDGNRQSDPFPRPRVVPYLPTADDYYLMSSVVKLYEREHPPIRIVQTENTTFALVGNLIYVSMPRDDEEMTAWVTKYAQEEEAFTRSDVRLMAGLFGFKLTPA